jgi:hypothetical protein
MSQEQAEAMPDELPTNPFDLTADGAVDQADLDIVEAQQGMDTLFP